MERQKAAILEEELQTYCIKELNFLVIRINFLVNKIHRNKKYPSINGKDMNF